LKSKIKLPTYYLGKTIGVIYVDVIATATQSGIFTSVSNEPILNRHLKYADTMIFSVLHAVSLNTSAIVFRGIYGSWR
jgi:hypothetical protein